MGLKIALIGYGRMGKAVEQIALTRNHSIVRIDPVAVGANFKNIDNTSLDGVDVCIDFTTPATAIENATKAANLGKNLVMGTTGWYDQTEKMKEVIQKSGTGFIWSGNFSVGMNVFFRIVRDAAKNFNNLPEYDTAVLEMHHNKKKDSPGGSAQIIGKIMLEELERKNKMVFDKFDRKPESNELHVASVRVGSVPGVHEVIFDCPIDTIELKHTARNLDGFAFGAVLAAEFINGKKGFYGIDELMNAVLKQTPANSTTKN